MKPEIKAQWVTALRSGEYQQTTGDLRRDDGFCCLGVLCDLHAKETGTTWTVDADGNYIYGPCDPWGILPAEVARWAGLENRHPMTEDGISLPRVNDSGTADFNFIADVIENNEII